MTLSNMTTITNPVKKNVALDTRCLAVNWLTLLLNQSSQIMLAKVKSPYESNVWRTLTSPYSTLGSYILMEKVTER